MKEATFLLVLVYAPVYASASACGRPFSSGKNGSSARVCSTNPSVNRINVPFRVTLVTITKDRTITRANLQSSSPPNLIIETQGQVQAETGYQPSHKGARLPLTATHGPRPRQYSKFFPWHLYLPSHRTDTYGNGHCGEMRTSASSVFDMQRELPFCSFPMKGSIYAWTTRH